MSFLRFGAQLLNHVFLAKRFWCNELHPRFSGLEIQFWGKCVGFKAFACFLFIPGVFFIFLFLFCLIFVAGVRCPSSSLFLMISFSSSFVLECVSDWLVQMLRIRLWRLVFYFCFYFFLFLLFLGFLHSWSVTKCRYFDTGFICFLDFKQSVYMLSPTPTPFLLPSDSLHTGNLGYERRMKSKSLSKLWKKLVTSFILIRSNYLPSSCCFGLVCISMLGPEICQVTLHTTSWTNRDCCLTLTQ